jgi:hypothetical protein
VLCSDESDRHILHGLLWNVQGCSVLDAEMEIWAHEMSYTVPVGFRTPIYFFI